MGQLTTQLPLQPELPFASMEKKYNVLPRLSVKMLPKVALEDNSKLFATTGGLEGLSFLEQAAIINSSKRQ